MKAICLIALCAVALTAAANDFTGTLVNPKGKPEKEIIVSVKGRGIYTESNKQGVFTVPVLPGDTLAIIASRTFHVYFVPGDATNAKFVLGKKDYQIELGDTTIKGEYVKIKNKRRNSDVLTREDIMLKGAHTLYEALRGSFAGVNVLPSTTGYRVEIRGASSINLSTEPLFIIDGIQYTSSEQANSAVAVEDIETIEVNKSGAGYGVNGGNGVIIITRRMSNYQSPMLNPSQY